MVLPSDKGRVLTLQRSLAAQRVAERFAANLAALRVTQPDVAALLPEQPPQADWALARDGSLSGRLEGRWLAGCSVPAEAAAVQFRKAQHQKGTIGLVDPLTGHHIHGALRTLLPNQSLQAWYGHVLDLAYALCVVDFSEAIAHFRLTLLVGDGWAEQMRGLHRRQPGLPILGEFLRQPQHHGRFYDDLVAEVTGVVRAIGQDVAERVENGSRRDGVLVIGGSAWKCWDDAGNVLARILPDADVLDTDLPAQSSIAAARLAAKGREGVLAANLFRSDIPHALDVERPWVTWLTTGRLLPRTAGGPRDQLLLADPDRLPEARRLGWSDAAVAGWPVPCRTAPLGRAVALLAPLAETEHMPEQVERRSGQRPLWEAAATLLDRDPFAAADVAAFVDRLAHQLAVMRYDRDLLIERWITPRVLRGVLAVLRSADVAVRHVEPESRAHWLNEVEHAAVLLNPSLTRPHAVDAGGRPVLQPTARSATELLATAKALLEQPTRPPLPILTGEVARTTLGCR